MVRRALTLAAILSSGGSALAADRYVAPGGDDAADGSQAAPWATIGFSATQVAAGDTVHVAPGTYAESITSSASGADGAPIVFVSDTPWGAKLDATGNYTGWHNTGDWVEIVGFDVSGSDYLGIYNEGSWVRVVGNHVHDLATPTCNG